MESKGLLLKVFGIIAFAFLISCAEDVDCFSNNSSLVKVTFFRANSVTVRPVAFDSIAIIGSRTDSTFLTVPTTGNLLNLPLDPFEDQTGFVFYRSTRTDTLILAYERFQRVISVQCGAEQAYGRLRMINSTFDSVAFINPSLLRTNETNIRIYE